MALSKEEKRAKKEAKKLAKLRAEAEARKALKNEQLKREMVAQARRRSELDKKWKNLMLKIKEPVFKEDIEVLWKSFDRTIDKKNHLINYTMKLINVADDQFQRTVSSFCDTIDTMIVNFLSDIEQLSQENDRRTADLLKMGKTEADQIKTDHDTAETHLQLLIFHGHSTADSLAWTTRGENLVKEDEDRNKYANERENLRSLLENSYNVMWDDYKAVLKNYVVKTAGNQKAVRKLRLKENLIADIIASQAKKIADSDGLLKKLRAELAAYESGTKQAVFRDRRDRHRAACFRLKKILTAGCDTDTKQMAKLVKASDSTIEWLESAHKKGEKILRLAALCRKYETQREKVLPFGLSSPHSPVQSKTNLRRLQSDDSLVMKAISTTCGLTRLWQRISKAELTRKALAREKLKLEEENAFLLRQIQERGENKLQSDENTCFCMRLEKETVVSKPVPIDGTFEMSKYKNT
ncbi:dynein regulatory complex subunit 2-like [Battus philenor]|uniref:dynein regulatory complex subunit 2-like n=1 Tax=Battus philenor TaxID=42288 RepID=UPI0035CFE71C